MRLSSVVHAGPHQTLKNILEQRIAWRDSWNKRSHSWERCQLPSDSQDSLTSENLNVSNETNESNSNFNFDDEKAKAGSHQTDLNYDDIVYDLHDGKYTKKFDAEDGEVRFRKETEESGEVTVRPLRLTPIGREQDPTPAYEKCKNYVKKRHIVLHFLQDCPKEQFTTVKKKKVLSKSYVRYQNYKLATSYEEFLALSISGKPQGQSTKKARSIAQADFRHDYDRGYIIFPGNVMLTWTYIRLDATR